MEFRIAREEFYKALQRVINVIPTKSTSEILYSVLLIAEDNQLKIIATDLEITQLSWCPANVIKEGAIAIPGKLLLDILREMPSQDIDFGVESNLRVLMKTQIGEYKIAGQARNEFPAVPIVNKEVQINLNNNRLKRMIEKTIFACSTSDSFRPALSGVLFQLMESEFRLVATDGHRLVRIIDKSFSLPSNMDQLRQFIVPTRALNFVARNLPEEGEHQVYIGGDHILFELPNTTIYSRLIKDPYPDYERVIPQNYEKQLEISRETFMHSVKRVSLFANPMTYQIILKIESNPPRVQIIAEDVDFGGEAREVIDCVYNFEPLTIAYNANYLLDLLRHLDSEEIIVKLEDPDGPGLIFPKNQEKNEDLLMLIMPVRLSETD